MVEIGSVEGAVGVDAVAKVAGDDSEAARVELVRGLEERWFGGAHGVGPDLGGCACNDRGVLEADRAAAELGLGLGQVGHCAGDLDPLCCCRRGQAAVAAEPGNQREHPIAAVAAAVVEAKESPAELGLETVDLAADGDQVAAEGAVGEAIEVLSAECGDRGLEACGGSSVAGGPRSREAGQGVARGGGRQRGTGGGLALGVGAAWLGSGGDERRGDDHTHYTEL